MAVRQRPAALAGIALAIVLAVALALIALMQDPERYRGEITAMLGETIGQPVELAGPLHLSWRPSPTLSAHDVRVVADGVQVHAQALQFVVEPPALLMRKLRVRRVVVQGLRIDLDAAPGVGVGAVRVPDVTAMGVQELELRDVAFLRAGEPWFAFDIATLREADSGAGARLDLSSRVDGRDLRARARLRTAPGQVELDALQVHLPTGVVNGQVRVTLGGQRTRITGELNADALTLGTRTGAGESLWRNLPVDLRSLANVDASLRVRIGRLSLARFMVSEITAPVSLHAGSLEVRAAGVLASGPLRATLNASVPHGRFTLDLALSGADAGNVLVMSGLTTAERGGRLALEAALRASGTDTAALLASLQGRLAVDASGLTVRAGAAKLAGSDVLAALLRALQPGASDRVTVGCAVGRFEVQDGVLLADNAIGMQSRSMNLLGGGRIALSNERVDLALQPWPRDGYSSLPPGMIGTVVITGPLADPQVGVASEARALVRTDADAVLPGDGLLSIARGLLERAHGDTPCVQATGSVLSSPGSSAAE